MTSWVLKWYIACPKMTWGSTQNTTSKSLYMLLLEFEFQLECMNFKPYPSTLFLIFGCSPTLSTTFISFSPAMNCSSFIYPNFPHVSHSWSLFEAYLVSFPQWLEMNSPTCIFFHPLNLRFSSRYMLDPWLGS